MYTMETYLSIYLCMKYVLHDTYKTEFPLLMLISTLLENATVKCNCSDACEALTYAVQPSQASLSISGVNQLLADALNRTKMSYRDQQELRSRVLPEEYENTIKHMLAVITSLDGEYSIY